MLKFHRPGLTAMHQTTPHTSSIYLGIHYMWFWKNDNVEIPYQQWGNYKHSWYTERVNESNSVKRMWISETWWQRQGLKICFKRQNRGNLCKRKTQNKISGQWMQTHEENRCHQKNCWRTHKMEHFGCPWLPMSHEWHDIKKFSALTLTVGLQKGHQDCKEPECWYGSDLNAASHVLRVLAVINSTSVYYQGHNIKQYQLTCNAMTVHR